MKPTALLTLGQAQQHKEQAQQHKEQAQQHKEQAQQHKEQGHKEQAHKEQQGHKEQQVNKRRIKKKLLILTDDICPEEGNNKKDNNRTEEMLHTLFEKYTLLNDKYQHLAEKMLLFESQLSSHTFTSKNKKSMTINSILQQNTAHADFMPFENFVSCALQQIHLKLLFKNKYEDGYLAILMYLFDQYQEKYDFEIVRAFNAQPNTVYVFASEAAGAGAEGAERNMPSWIVWSTSAMMQVVNVIYKQIIREFALWQKEIANQMAEDDDLANEYATQLKKIIVNPATMNNFGTNLLKKIYKRIKSDLL